MNATHTYHAEVNWQRGASEVFTDNRYSRRHVLRFDGGAEVPGSSSPLSVPLPFSDPAAVDPEEAFVASIAACHMLWFLSLAAKAGYVVSSYRDPASGVMTKNAAGKLWLSRVRLRPQTEFDGQRRPSREELLALHHRAHEECFIANSVRTGIDCEPT
ncbi:MAG: OsmC family protein [Aquincola sp.]|nr:OsmC family protein [Aquincola sp.]MDH4288894.1 OsmC family protein [Aquincola sp.]MDH5329243.1 OsmC family protein [Aquincola sp.]